MDRKKLMKWCVIFFVIMMMFTVVSRAAASMSVAQVTTGKIQNQTITHIVRGSGRVAGTRERAVFVQAGQLVEQVLVREGQTVKKGDVLLVFSKKQLKESIREKKDRIEALSLQIGDLESQAHVKATEREKAKRRAHENYNIAAGNGGVTIMHAQKNLEAARQKLDDYYASLSSDFTDEPVDQAVERALLDEIRMCQEAVDQAVMSSNQGTLAANREIEDARAEDARDSTIENVKREAEQVREELAELEKLLKRKGKIKAPADGVVKSISAVTGSMTGEMAAAVLYETAGALRVEITISAEDVKYVQAGGEVMLTGADAIEKTGIVEAVTESEESPELRKVSIAVPEGDFRIGENVNAEIKKEEGPYSACVPLSALGEENGNSFVYVLDTQETVLGEALVARKVQVMIRNKNNSLAALEDGTLSAEQKIIVSADRAITEGSRVRLQEP